MSGGTPKYKISSREFDAVIFDLDGVVTRTAGVHAATWKELFDEFLRKRAESEGGEFRAFDGEADYQRYVDGKPRYDGIKSFLESRGIELEYGSPGDGADKETVCGLANKKNRLFRAHLKRDGVEVYDSTIALIRKLQEHGLKIGIVSSSKNCAPILDSAGLTEFFEVKVDGVDSAEMELPGKPAPDIFLEAAQQLGVEPSRAVVVEDALSGVQAGRRGGFGCVIGVDRVGQADALKQQGADVVVSDLSEVEVSEEPSADRRRAEELPSALERLEETVGRSGHKPAVFLDYDGTLTPIVARPELAVMSDEMRGIVRDLARCCPVAVISGRDLRDVRDKVGLEEIIYAGSHGFDIAGPGGLRMENEQAAGFVPALDAAERELLEQLGRVPGAQVERKRFSIAAHYRNVADERAGEVEEAVDAVLARHRGLRKGHGKKVFEIQPRIDWHKGRALLWLLRALGLDQGGVLPIYIGDDLTDEDAFKALRGRGLGIVVREEPRRTAAAQALENPAEVGSYLRRLAELIGGGVR
jgi:trehalose-phosphatase